MQRRLERAHEPPGGPAPARIGSGADLLDGEAVGDDDERGGVARRFARAPSAHAPSWTPSSVDRTVRLCGWARRAYDHSVTTIAAAHGVVAPFGYSQAEITAAFSSVVSPDGQHHALIERIHQATGVEHRNLALPLEAYRDLSGFGAANDAFIRVALDLGEEAIFAALARAGLSPSDVDLVMATSVTGIAAPSIEALLVPRLGLRPDVKRLPVFGLGCVAGASGVARLHDYLLGSSRRGRRAALRRTVLADRSARRRVDAEHRRERTVRGRGCRRRHGGGAPGRAHGAGRARRHRLAQPAVSGHGPHDGLGHRRQRASASCCRPASPTSSSSTSATTSPTSSRTTTSRRGDIAAWVCHPGGPKVLRGHGVGARPPRRRARRDLALARRDRQPVLRVRAARAR